MDFVVGLPYSRDGCDSIWANYGQVNQVSSFLPVKATHFVVKLAKLYIKHIVCLHGVPTSIEFDRGSIFTSRFGKNCRRQWAPNLISVLLSILRQMVNLRERSKHLKIC